MAFVAGSSFAPSAREALAAPSLSSICGQGVLVGRPSAARARVGARSDQRTFHVAAELPTFAQAARFFAAVDVEAAVDAATSAATFDPLPTVTGAEVEAAADAVEKASAVDQILGAFYILFFIGCAGLTAYSIKVTAEENNRKAEKAKRERAAKAEKSEEKEMNRETRRRMEKMERRKRR